MNIISNNLINSLHEEIIEANGSHQSHIESWNQPGKFWTNLKLHRSELHKSVSSIEGPINFYNDCFTKARISSDQRALKVYSHENTISEISYRELYIHSNNLANYWESKGLTHESKVVFLFPFGIDYVIHLMAALKLGVVFTFLPSSSPLEHNDLIQQMDAQYIISKSEFGIQLLHETTPLLLTPDTIPDSDNLHTFNYSPEEAVCHVHDPLTQSSEINALSAKYLYHQCIRDGYFYMQLHIGEQVLVNSDLPELLQPSLILTTLLNGASLVSLDLKKWSNPYALSEINANIIIANPKLRDYCTSHNISLKSCRLYLANIRDEVAPHAWLDFHKLIKNKNTQQAFIFYSAATGGAILYGQKNKDFLSLNLTPVPGIAIEWKNSIIKDTSANLSIQSLSHKDPGMTMDKRIILLVQKNTSAWSYIGISPSWYRNISYPTHKIESLVQKFLPDSPSCLISINDSWLGHQAQVLCLFSTKKNIAKLLNDKLNKKLGALYPIHRIEIYNFPAPLNEDNEVDRNYVQFAYINGILEKKQKSPSFQEIQKLINKLQSL
jgi:hypothetical protein